MARQVALSFVILVGALLAGTPSRDENGKDGPHDVLVRELTSLTEAAKAITEIEMAKWHNESTLPPSAASLQLSSARTALDLGIQASTTVDVLLTLCENMKCADDKAAVEVELNNRLSTLQVTASGAGSTLEIVAGGLEKGSKEAEIATDAADRLKKLFLVIGKIKLTSFPHAKRFGDK
jgi:hypothetical protein